MVNSKGKLLTFWWATSDCCTIICTVKSTAVAVAVKNRGLAQGELTHPNTFLICSILME